MTTTRVPVPTTNLKERIAALEQRNASKTPNASRPVSPTPLVPSSSASTTSNAPGFRDKIAKFERKGGVPVPRGRFGLGAPPPNTHGPSRQGELYGNRIPAPARTVSVGSSIYPGTGSAAVSRAASPTFSNVGGAGDRRSFSLSSVGDFESEAGGPDYTPIASPTFTFPPDSPETVLSPSASELGLGGTPEVSPALNLNGEAANFVKPVVKVRGTSFQKALEIARNAEQAKLAGGLSSPESAGAGATPTGAEGNGVQSPVGGEEGGPDMEMPLQLQVQQQSQQEQSSTTELGLGQDTEVQAAPSADSASPSPSPSPFTALPAASPAVSPSASASIPSPALTDDTVLSPTVVSPTTVVSPSVVSPSIASPQEERQQVPSTAAQAAMVIAPTIEVTPLTIRKRGLSLSQTSADLATPSAEVPPLPTTQPKEMKPEEEKTASTALSKEDEARGTASLASPSELPSPSSLQSSPGVPPPRYSSLHHTFFTVKDEEPTTAAVSSTRGSTSPESQRVRPLPQVPPPTATVGASPEGAAASRDADDDIAPPSIVVSDTSARTPSRKNSSNLTLNSSALKNASQPQSTLVVSDDATTANNNNRASANSITEVLTTYFKGPATPPMSPAAKLAYDASPEASPGLVRRQTEPANLSAYASANASANANGTGNANTSRPAVPAAINPPDPASFLSPPQTGLAPSSGGTSSIGSFSSLNSASRPYSMSLLEGSPTTQVHTALRMTPATSRGVPMFLPPVSATGMPGTGRVRKSDWGHFPPTPTGVGEEGEQGREGEEMGDGDEAEFGSVVVTQHKGAKSMVDFSELGVTRAATVSGATRTQFTAVVHGKVREATVPLPSSSSSSAAAPSSLGSSSRKAGVPQTPQQQKEGRRNKRDTILETPLSPGHGELAALLQEAMLLEDTLSRGTLPAEEVDSTSSNVLSSSQQSQGERKKLETIRESEGQSKTKEEREKEQKEKEERKRIAAAQALLQAKRDEPTSGKLKHTFLIPLSKARSQHRKEVSAPASAGGQTPTSAYPPTSARGETFPFSMSGSTTSLHRLEEPQPPVPPRPKSAGVPEQGHGRTRSQSKSRPVTPENQAVTPTPGMGTRQPQPQTPSKSPGSRFGSFSRRIGGAISGHGAGRPSTIHGASAHTHGHGHGHGRYSNSTSSEISSIDSQPVATPPEGMLEFGVVPLRVQHTGTSVRSAVPSVSVSEYGRNGTGMGNGSQTSFPSLSPKKSASSLGRATSFAEKMWSRARTKSSGSTLSTASEVTIDDSAPRLPALGPPPALELSTIPGMEKELPRVVNPPKRSTSLKRHNNDLPPIPTEPLPPLPVITSSSAFDPSKPPVTPPKPTAKTPVTSKSTSQAPQLPQLPDVSISDISNDSLLTPGFTADSASRSSWTSMSSAGSLGSLPSPLFDKDLFDAFPSVPGTMPVPQPGDVFGGGRRETTIPMGAAAAAVAGAGGKGPMPFDAALLSSAIHLQGRRSGETAR